MINRNKKNKKSAGYESDTPVIISRTPMYNQIRSPCKSIAGGHTYLRIALQVREDLIDEQALSIAHYLPLYGLLMGWVAR